MYKQLFLCLCLLVTFGCYTVVNAQDIQDQAGLLLAQNKVDHSGHNHAAHGHEGHNHAPGEGHGQKATVKRQAGHEGHNHGGHGHNHGYETANHAAAAGHGHAHGDGHASSDGHGSDSHGKKDLNIKDMILNHITDANEFHAFGNFSVPLPCITYGKEQGFNMFLSNKFHHGHDSYKGFVMDHGVLNYVDDPSFPKDKVVHVGGFTTNAEGQRMVSANGKQYPVSRSNFWDLSITKVVFTMLLAALIMLWLFPSIARAYLTNEVPKGKQALLEPVIAFVRDDIAIPHLGINKYKKFFPFLLTLFFFIWICNLLGLIPFFPGSGNVMGNIMVTFTLALITFIMIAINGNKHYWQHIFNPPGVPMAVKPLMILIEFASIFIKPVALMIRLFANITAGHIIILSLVGIIFIIANIAGTAGGFGTSIVSGAFLLFMNVLELFVAALQAYIFTTLTAVFLGQAVAEPHHH